MDGTIVLAKELVLSRYAMRMYFRIDVCRICGNDTKTHFLDITDTGILWAGNSLVSSK